MAQVLDTPEGIRFFTVNAVALGLALEITTGMVLSSRGSGIKAAQIQRIIPAGKRTTRKAALKATVAELKRLNPEWEPTGFIEEALAR